MKHVILIEDEESICDVLSVALPLRFKDIALEIFTDIPSTEVLEQLDYISLIISDCRLPSGSMCDHVDFLTWVCNKHIPLIITSGDYMLSKDKFPGTDHIQVLDKPYMLEELFALCSLWIE